MIFGIRANTIASAAESFMAKWEASNDEINASLDKILARLKNISAAIEEDVVLHHWCLRLGRRLLLYCSHLHTTSQQHAFEGDVHSGSTGDRNIVTLFPPPMHAVARMTSLLPHAGSPSHRRPLRCQAVLRAPHFHRQPSSAPC